MVKVNRTSRRRMLDAYSDSHSKLLNRHFLNLLLLGVIALVIAVYFFLLTIQTREATETSMAAAHSASRILSARQPYLIYGTAWKKEKTADLVRRAVLAGFRFIDTACQPKHYNEAGVGEGWSRAAAEMKLDRSDVFLQTKFTAYDGQDPNNVPYDHTQSLEDQIKESLKVSLRNLKTTYLDSLVMHSPEPNMDDTMRLWRVMETFVDEGTVKRIGISNCYNMDKLSRLYEMARIKPAVLQNRFHDRTNFDTHIRRFCKERDITYQSFWSLTANHRALHLPAAEQWAERLGLTPQTLMFAFLMSTGYITPLSGTTSDAHMAQDVAIMERMQNGEVFFKDEQEMRSFAQILGMPDL